MSGSNTITFVSIVLGAAWLGWMIWNVYAVATYKPPMKGLQLNRATTARLVSAIGHLLDGRPLWAHTIYGPDLIEHALAYFKARYAVGEMPLERYERMVDTLLKASDLMERES